MTGYVTKSEGMLHPKEEPTKNTNGLQQLYIRELLDNGRLAGEGNIIATMLFMDIKADQSIIIFDSEGENEFSRGTFADVYEETDEKLDGIKRTVGLIPVDRLIELDGAKELYDTLGEHKDADVRLDSYTISNYIVMPVKVTVLDRSGSEIKSVEFPSSGDAVQRENIYIYSGYDLNYEGERKEDNRLYTDMKTAYLGERRSDRIADKVAKEVDLSRDEMVTKYKLGFGHIASKSYQTADGRAMVWVYDCDYMKSLLIWAGIICVPVTLIVFLVGRKKKNDY